MQVIEFISAYGAWAWVLAGLLFLGLELVAPGGILLWLGIAGVVTGLASLFQPIAWPAQFVLFGLLSLVSIYVWLRYAKARPDFTDRPLLNRRADRFFGREAVLDEPISSGFGRVALEDTTWRVMGPDLPAGQRVRIIGHEGAVLRVEPV